MSVRTKSALSAHYYLGHGVGCDSAEAPFIDLGLAFDDTVELAPGMVFVLEPVVWRDGVGGYRSEELHRRHRRRLEQLTAYGYTPFSERHTDRGRSDSARHRTSGPASPRMDPGRLRFVRRARTDRLRADRCDGARCMRAQPRGERAIRDGRTPSVDLAVAGRSGRRALPSGPRETCTCCRSPRANRRSGGAAAGRRAPSRGTR